MRPRTIIAAAGAAGALGLGAAGVAVATGGSQPPPAPAASFRAHLAQRLGVSPGRLRQATKAAAEDTVKQMRAEGKIDARRAARLERLIARTGAAPFARFGPPRGVRIVRRTALRAEAKALGIDVRTLRHELHSGRSPAAVIAAHGKDRSTVEAAVRSAVEQRADTVLAGPLAERIAQRVAARLTGTTALPRRP